MGLGFLRSDFTTIQRKEFSRGWRMRIELAKILCKNQTWFCLMSPPTTWILKESVQWLEEFLKNSAKGVIVISHDKAFVDNLTNRTIEVTMGRIYDYKTSHTRITCNCVKKKTRTTAKAIWWPSEGNYRYSGIYRPIQRHLFKNTAGSIPQILEEDWDCAGEWNGYLIIKSEVPSCSAFR